MMIAFTGMDGSGKSLQAKALSQALISQGFACRYIWSRWSPWLIKPIIGLGRRWRGRKGSTEEEQYRTFRGEKRKIFRRAWAAAVWKNLAFFDYLVQMFFKVRWYARPGRVLICDRYLTDLLVDLGNNFGYGPESISRMCRSPWLSLFTKPDHIFLLDLPAEVAFERKEDMPLSYLRDRRALYLSLGRIQGAEILDGNASIEALRDQIYHRALSLLTKGEDSHRPQSPDRRH